MAHGDVHAGDVVETLSHDCCRFHKMSLRSSAVVRFFRPLRWFGGTTGEGLVVDPAVGSVKTGAGLPRIIRISFLLALAVFTAACGESPLDSLGQRSSDWMSEPTIITTKTVAITVPVVVESETLKWFNDDLTEDDLSDVSALSRAIFRRRAGDLFVQSSREEIVALVPGIRFPEGAPYLAEYVTSQIVFEPTGEISGDPIVALGIWSAEPYTRSRTVAQMAVLRVFSDQETASELRQPGVSFTCARFTDRATEQCETLEIEGLPYWRMTASDGQTILWFDGQYRYELFGRKFVTAKALEQMATDTMLLRELEPGSG